MANSKRKDLSERRTTPPAQTGSLSAMPPQTPSSSPLQMPSSSPTSPSPYTPSSFTTPSSSTTASSSINASTEAVSSSSTLLTATSSPSTTISTVLSSNPGSIAAQAIFDRLNAPDLCGAYIAASNISQRVEFQTGKNIDILVHKGSNSEFILRGVFLIARNDFFLTPDGSYNPDNNFRSAFEDTKLACRMTVPASNDFPFAISDFPRCIKNLLSLQKLITLDKGDETMSMVTEYLGKPQFKVTHALFDAKSQNSEEELHQSAADDDSDTTDTLPEFTDDHGTEFAMENWPVAERCQPSLQNLHDTHDICPLPAYDLMGKLIPPSQYEMLLRGALVQFHFSFAHHYIKKHKRHIFNCIIRRIDVLRPPSALPTSPFKRMRISASNHHTSYGKGKRRAY